MLSECVPATEFQALDEGRRSESYCHGTEFGPHCHAGAFRQEKGLYVDASQPLGRFLPQLHSIAEGEASGLRDASGALMPPCIIMEKGEALDVWIANSGDNIDLFTGLQVCF